MVLYLCRMSLSHQPVELVSRQVAQHWEGPREGCLHGSASFGTHCILRQWTSPAYRMKWKWFRTFNWDFRAFVQGGSTYLAAADDTLHGTKRANHWVPWSTIFVSNFAIFHAMRDVLLVLVIQDFQMVFYMWLFPRILPIVRRLVSCFRMHTRLNSN